MGTRLDDYNFHESVNLSEFDNSRTLVVTPPDGEVSTFVLNKQTNKQGIPENSESNGPRYFRN